MDSLSKAKEHIEKFMYEGSLYHLGEKDYLIKDLVQIIEHQRKMLVAARKHGKRRKQEVKQLQAAIFRYKNSSIDEVKSPEEWDAIAFQRLAQFMKEE